MQITADTLDLKPPQPGRWSLPVLLALAAHVLLMGALTWGVHWKQDAEPVTFEAEIWSSLPREAAPRAVEPPPPPPPPPEPEVKPKPKPVVKPTPAPEPELKDPQIAIDAAKKKKAEAEKKKAEEKKALEKREALEEEKDKKLAKEKAEKAEKLQAKNEETKKKLAEQKRELAAKEAADERAKQKMRDQQMARMMGQAGASGGPEARGSAAQSSGPSSGYGDRVAARIRPNIRYTEDFPNSLRTEIDVRALPDGTITARRVSRSSGNPAWDDAALRAIDRTAMLPRDVDGRVPSSMTIVVRPID